MKEEKKDPGKAFQLKGIDDNTMAIIKARAALLHKNVNEYLIEIIFEFHKDFNVNALLDPDQRMS